MSVIERFPRFTKPVDQEQRNAHLKVGDGQVSIQRTGFFEIRDGFFMPAYGGLDDAHREPVFKL